MRKYAVQQMLTAAGIVLALGFGAETAGPGACWAEDPAAAKALETWVKSLACKEGGPSPLQLKSQAGQDFEFILMMRPAAKKGGAGNTTLQFFVQSRGESAAMVAYINNQPWAVIDAKGLWLVGENKPLRLYPDMTVQAFLKAQKNNAALGILPLQGAKAEIDLQFGRALQAVLSLPEVQIKASQGNTVAQVAGRKDSVTVFTFDKLAPFPLTSMRITNKSGAISVFGFKREKLCLKIEMPQAAHDDKMVERQSAGQKILFQPPRLPYPSTARQKKAAELFSQAVKGVPGMTGHRTAGMLLYQSKRLLHPGFSPSEYRTMFNSMELSIRGQVRGILSRKETETYLPHRIVLYNDDRRHVLAQLNKDIPGFSTLITDYWLPFVKDDSRDLFQRKMMLRLLSDTGVDSKTAKSLPELARQYPELNPYWSVCMARLGQARPEDVNLLRQTLMNAKCPDLDRLECFDALSMTPSIKKEDIAKALELFTSRPTRDKWLLTFQGYHAGSLHRYINALAYSPAGVQTLWDILESDAPIDFPPVEMVLLLNRMINTNPRSEGPSQADQLGTAELLRQASQLQKAERSRKAELARRMKRLRQAVRKLLFRDKKLEKRDLYIAVSVLYGKDGDDKELRKIVQKLIAARKPTGVFNAAILAQRLKKPYSLAKDFLTVYDQSDLATKAEIITAYSYPRTTESKVLPEVADLLMKGLREKDDKSRILAAAGLAFFVIYDQYKWRPAEKQRDELLAGLVRVGQSKFPLSQPKIIRYRIWKAIEDLSGKPVPIGLPDELRKLDPWQNSEAFRWWTTHADSIREGIRKWGNRNNVERSSSPFSPNELCRTATPYLLTGWQ